jgi:hypothetical protein
MKLAKNKGFFGEFLRRRRVTQRKRSAAELQSKPLLFATAKPCRKKILRRKQEVTRLLRRVFFRLTRFSVLDC